VIECDLGLATSVSMEDVCTLFSALDNAVNKLIHVGSSEVSAHPHLCMYVLYVCMNVCMYVCSNLSTIDRQFVLFLK
jgi:hypothetical protein